MNRFSSWLDRFLDYVQHEPVRAAEAVRVVLFTITGALVFIEGADEVAAQVSAVVTALFSLYASKKSRDSVQPVVTIPPKDLEEMSRTDNV